MKQVNFVRKFFFVLLVSISFLPGIEAESVFNHKTSPNDPFFNEVLSNLSSRKIVKSDFIQRKELKELNRQFISRGIFIYHDIEGILWNTQTPFPLRTIMNNDGITQISRSGKKTKIGNNDNPVFGKFSESFSAVLCGNTEILQREFDMFFQPSGKTGWKIGLVPKSEIIGSVIESIIMTGDTDLETVILKESTGDRIVYEFRNTEYPARLSHNDRESFK